jgi:hypothetical protein
MTIRCDHCPVARRLESAETARVRIPLLLLLSLLASLAAVPAAALAKDGRPEVRTSVSCGGGVTAELRLRAQDGVIGARFEVGRSRAGIWHIVFVHERRVAWRGSARSSFEVERSLPDFPGSDTVSARATGPRGVVCQAVGVLSDVSTPGNGTQGGYG